MSLKSNLDIWIILSSLFLLLAEYSAAQPQLTFKRYTVEDGLSHNSVRDILLDSAGFLWVATDDGLNKFDGYTFHKYLYSQESSNLINHLVITLQEDANHNIWVGTWGGGLYKYEQKFDRFQQIVETADSNRLNLNFVYDIYSDTQGRMWVGTVAGLARIDINTHKVKLYQYNASQPQSLSNNRAISITEDTAGNLWVGTLGGGINYFVPERETFERYQYHEDNPSSLSHDDIFSVFYDSRQRLWVGTWDNGLNLMKNREEGFEHFQHNPNDSHSLPNNQVWSITEDKDGKIWIVTDNGLCLFNEAENNFFVYKNDPFDTKSLSSNISKNICIDRENRLWVGTYDGGLNLYDPRFHQIQHYYRKKDYQSLSDNRISAIVGLDSTRVLVGTDGGGLNLLDRESGNFTHYIHSPNDPNSIGDNKIKTLLKDRNGGIWIGFWNGGLDHFDLNTQQFTHFKKDPNNAETWLNSNNVTCLAEDQNGLIWMGTFGGGVLSYDPVKKYFATYTQYPMYDESVSDRNIWAILVDRENNIWIGTSNGRVDLLDRKQNRLINVFPKQSESQGYSVVDLFEDSQGHIWAGLEGGGLRQLDRNAGVVTTYTYNDGLPSNTVNAIEESENGQLWISTNNGLARIDTASRFCKSYNVSEELQGLYFTRQASEKLASGELMFGGPNGFNVFHPDSLVDSNIEFPIVFTSLDIFNEPVAVGEDNFPLQYHINNQDAITLTHEQSVFSISYAGLHFHAPEHIQYQYRLQKFVDDGWQLVGNERKATYTNLQPGNYIFEVTGSIKDGQTMPSRLLSITVIPPWWKTAWFRVVAGLCLLSILYTLYWLRSKNILQQNHRLEKEVKERTLKLEHANSELHQKNLMIQEKNEEIQTQAEELSESNEEIRSINQRLEDIVTVRTTDLKKSNEELDNFVYRVSHDIRAPLSSVLGLLELMNMEKNPAALQNYREMAAKSINRLDGFVKSILDYSRNSRVGLNRKNVDFSKLLNDILEELQHMKNADRLHVIRNIKIEVPYHNDPMRMEIILRNLLSNAIKYQNLHVDNSYVKIQISVTSPFVTILIEDNGIGIREQQVKKVFDMFYRGNEQAPGSGIGLYIVKETVDKLGGSITLSSQYELGTTFTIKLPNDWN